MNYSNYDVCAIFSQNHDINLNRNRRSSTHILNGRLTRKNPCLRSGQIIIDGFKVKQINFVLSHHHKRSRNLLSLNRLKQKYAATKEKKQLRNIRIKSKRQIKMMAFFLLTRCFVVHNLMRALLPFPLQFFNCLRNNCAKLQLRRNQNDRNSYFVWLLHGALLSSIERIGWKCAKASWVPNVKLYTHASISNDFR